MLISMKYHSMWTMGYCSSTLALFLEKGDQLENLDLNLFSNIWLLYFFMTYTSIDVIYSFKTIIIVTT